MIYTEFAKGKKDTALIIGPKYYDFKTFIGSNYGIPLKKYITDFQTRLITVSTFEPADGKKPTKKVLQPYIDDLVESCDTLGIKNLLVANAEYFKILSGQKTFEDNIGYVFSCVIPSYEHIKVTPVINAAVMSAQPNKKPLLERSVETAGMLIAGTYSPPVEHEFETYQLISDPVEAAEVCQELMTRPILTADIETTGLRVGESEVLTIAFAWDKYNAVTFAVHEHFDSADVAPVIKQFLIDYQGQLVFHNALFDVKQLVYTWWMKDFSNYEGLYQGLEDIGMNNLQDTMLMAYAELNSTERPQLGLKVLAKEFLGDWSEDVKDCKSVELDVLAYYNAKDTVGTYYLLEKYGHQQASRIYKEILQPSLEYLLHEMLNGVPISIPNVDKALEDITKLIEEAEKALKNDGNVKQTEAIMNHLACLKYNATHKSQKNVEDFASIFNPNSSTQLRILLFDVIGLEPLDFTDTGLAKTDRASIIEFMNTLPEDSSAISTLEALKIISETSIIKTTFLAAFKEMSIEDTNGNYTLHGNHRLGGTMSGRLSSSEPNMANTPSNSRFGKVIKSCFVPPEGWLYAYADYNALEDRVSTLLTKDPMKLKEVMEGFEGHSLRSSFYFKEELEERGLFIDISDKESVNRIQHEAKDLRQKSKGVTFLKIYGGAAGKIQKTLKCSRETADSISEAFDELYKVTKQFNDSNTLLAKQQGYLDVAFGLRVRCPRINSKDSGISSSEGRSINNSSTQSYGMLTNKASILFLEKLKVSEHKLNIKMINQVHDCIYFVVKDIPSAIKWLNDTLINECMSWVPEELNGSVPMSAELDIGVDASHCYTLNNSASVQEIQELINEIII